MFISQRHRQKFDLTYLNDSGNFFHRHRLISNVFIVRKEEVWLSQMDFQQLVC